MNVKVTVYKDKFGYYASGVPKSIPTESFVSGPFTATNPQDPQDIRSLLRVEHPTFGWYGISETANSYATKVNAVECPVCASSGGGTGTAETTDYFTISDIANPTLTLSHTYIPGSVKLYRGTLLTPGVDFNEDAANTVTLTFSPSIGDVFAANYNY